MYPIANYPILYEVEPQHICLTGANESELSNMGPPSPFSGCLQHLESLHWNGAVYYLLPDLMDDVILQWIRKYLRPPQIYLDLSLAEILRNSAELKAHLQNNEKALEEHRIATTIVKNKLLDLHNAVIRDANHRRWDFLFTSSTAQQYFSVIFTPVLMIIWALIILYICNCWMYQKMKKLYQSFVFQKLHVNYAYASTQP